MEVTPRKAGRPAVASANRKKNRAISLTDAEYRTLEQLAAKAGYGVSKYVVHALKLS